MQKINREEILSKFIEISIHSSDDFLKIRETLSRIGIVNEKTKTLTQSCHILHKRGKYYIVHFKEMFALDGKPSTITEEDIDRRNGVATVLETWGMCRILSRDLCYRSSPETLKCTKIFVLPFCKKTEYNLVSKYKMGVK